MTHIFLPLTELYNYGFILQSVMLSALVALASGLFFSKGAVLFPVEMPSLPGIMLNCTSQQSVIYSPLRVPVLL